MQTVSNFQAIQLEVDQGIATILLNRPEVLNAIDSVMRRK